MKKHLYFLSAALLAAASAGAQGLAFDFRTGGSGTQADFESWSVYDLNEDEKTWVWSDDATPSRVYYTYHGSNAADDWMISPAVTMDNDGYFMVSYTLVGSSYGEQYEVWTGNGSTPADMTDMRDSGLLQGMDHHPGYFMIPCAKGDTFNVGLHATSEADKWRLYLLDINMLNVTNPVDLRVSEITSPVTDEGLGMENVTIEVANDGMANVEGYDICYRVGDGETVREHIDTPLPAGFTAVHTFATPADLSGSRMKYRITAWTEHPDDFMPSNNACTVTVKHIGPASIPYFNGFEDPEEIEDLTYANLNGDDGYWHVVTNDWTVHFSRTGDRCLGYNYNKDNAADDWAFLEGVQMQPGYYALKFWYSATENHPERLRVCWGNRPEPEAMTNVLVEYNPAETVDYLESINIFEVKEEGQVYIGFYCFSDKDENWLLVDDVAIEAVDPSKADLILSDVTKPDAYWRAPARAEVVATVQSVSMVDTEAEIVVTIDGAENARLPFSILAMQKLTLTVPMDMEGIGTGAHNVQIEVVCGSDSNLANNSAERVVVVLAGEPVAVWDFEDQQLPEAFTYRSEDSRTVSPEAGDEFDELGFGIFHLSHYMLGEYALAWASWFEDGWYTDRWLVMPRMHVNGPAWFTWEAMSYNPNFPEQYNVRVSTGDDYWAHYETQLGVSKETEYVKTRGIDLTPFEGQDVYVAFQLKTEDGEALVLDNLSFYGDIITYEDYLTAVGAIGTEEGEARWYTLSGIEVDADNAPAGIYIVRQGAKATKVIKR